ncbi:MAG: transposase [bacterium]|nr:transposase [bacterium]
MGRIARIVAPGMPHHITQRGNRRMPTFLQDDDYAVYLDLMKTWCACHEVEIWAYCLMPNHVHLIAVPETLDGLARAIGEAHRRYTLHINQREGWRGYLWQGRFGSFVMDEDYLLTAMRYVELNPVRAGLAASPADWPWSSARAHLTGQPDSLIGDVSGMVDYVGDWERYLALDVEEDELVRLREHTRTGRPLGGDAFIHHLEEILGRLLRKRKPGPKGSGKDN